MSDKTGWPFDAYQDDPLAARNVAHGGGGRLVSIRTGPRRHDMPEYWAWVNMLRRCTNQQDPSYHNYGARGIQVCERWRDSFEAFYVDLGPRPQGLTLERLNVNGHYEPGNCCWATRARQQQNRRKRPDVSSRFRGVTWDAAERKWAAQIGVAHRNISLGRFADEEDAAHAYDAAAVTHFGPNAAVNFPADAQQKEEQQ